VKTFRGGGSPFSERPHFSDLEIDQMCEDALRKVGLLPSKAEPVRIERFTEKHFGVSPAYEDMPAGVLGYTTFSAKGVKSIHIAKFLLDDVAKVTERRLNSTLAHEAGHGLMHAYLFAFEDAGLSMFGRDADVTASKVLCRDSDRGGRGGYDGRWWELQANKAIGGLLLPRAPVLAALRPLLPHPGRGDRLALDDPRRESAVAFLVDAFEVNPIVARIRVESLFPGPA
jgi:hypothetical protein